MEIEYARKEETHKVTDRSLNHNLSNHKKLNSGNNRMLLIPWEGRMLRATYSQIKEYEGDLERIKKDLGSTEIQQDQKNYRIRFLWKGKILWPSAEELKSAKGDLNDLSNICQRVMNLPPRNYSFRGRGQPENGDAFERKPEKI